MPDSRVLNRKSRRRGTATMELMLVLPILLTLIVGLFEFSVLFLARSQVVESARAGARAASRWKVGFEVVEREVRLVLGPALQQGLLIDVAPGEHSGDAVTVAVRVPMKSACPDLLWAMGLSLEGRYFSGAATMIKE